MTGSDWNHTMALGEPLTELQVDKFIDADDKYKNFDVAAAVVLFIAIALLAQFNYLLFHMTVEMFSIVVAFGIFMLVWNTRRFLDNNFFVLIGISYASVSVIDMVHSMSYQGMGVFPGNTVNEATQLWIVARYLQAISFILAIVLMRKWISAHITALIYVVIIILVFLDIFLWGFVPDCFILGEGLTPFKKVSEYVIIGLFLISMYLLYRRRDSFARTVFLFLQTSLALTIVAELSFTLYNIPTGLPNLIGHLLKLIAFYCVYRAIVETGLRKPYQSMFRELKLREERLWDERNFITAVVETQGALVVVLDGEGRILRFNRACEATSGYTVNEVRGKKFQDFLLVQDEYEKVLNILEELLTGNCPNENENYWLSRNGDLRRIKWSNTCIHDTDGKVAFIVATGLDVTEERQAQEELLSTTRDLERSNKELEQFATIVSHDLKQPLFSIICFSKLLKKKFGESLEEKASEFLDSILLASTRMQELLEGLLSYARLESKGTEKTEIDCNDLLDKILLQMEAILNEKNAQVTHDDLPTLVADPILFGQVFQNLIANSVKFCDKDIPKVHISANERGSDWGFSVSDNGIGIDPKDVERIFGVFQRLHTEEDYPGTGVGLSICKKVIEYHRGEIWVESEPEQGTTFFFSIPKKLQEGDD